MQAVTFPRLIPSAAPASLSLMATYEELAIISVLFWNTSLLSLNIIIYWALTLYQKLDRTLYATNLISASPQPHKFHVTISILPLKDWDLLVTEPHLNPDSASLSHTLWVPHSLSLTSSTKFKEKEIMGSFLMLTRVSLHCPYNVHFLSEGGNCQLYPFWKTKQSLHPTILLF